ncbi:response regulator [Psychrobium sp. 1_MG-2023]|uniref:tetratricopeptide repeat-containing hybrid sensor histidine kinase/response regulator n=1 Tax=Psychrobium sp. 1_MG-2023 TaxID=3062624 RepID=UPI0027357594|nr:response regulator [Psychrobium sp. 1_MG-2023]MDP2560791.1 response regulator [Psychrobium sp. 1_MG-2023]
MRYFVKLIIIFSWLTIWSISAPAAISENLQQKLNEIVALEDKQRALLSLEQLLQSHRLTPSVRAEIALTQARIYVELKELTVALKVLQEASLRINGQGLDNIESKINKAIGVVYYYKSNYPQALIFYDKVKEYYQTSEQPLALAHMYNNIGLVQAAMYEMKDALLSYQQAESLYKIHGSAVDLVDLKMNVGGLFFRTSRYDTAIDIYNEVIAGYRELNDEEGLALTYGDIGNSYRSAKKFEQSEYYLKKSFNYYKKTDNKYFMGSQHNNFAELYNMQGRHVEAMQHAEQAVTLGLRWEHYTVYAAGLTNLAVAQFVIGDTENAIKNVNLSIAKSKELNEIQKVNASQMVLALFRSSIDERAEAVKGFYQFKGKQEEQSNKGLEIELAQYRALLESEQLQKEVSELTQKRAIQQLKLDKAEQERYFILLALFLILCIGFFIYRRNIERDLKRQLSLQVKQRTQELELLMDDLHRANEIKSKFLANMSHEIRTPLTAVIGQAEAIICGDVDEAYINKEVEIIFNNSNHLLNLINDILDLSRIEADKLELEIKPHDLHALLDELVDLFTEQAVKKGLHFKIVRDIPQPMFIEVDRIRLLQILINLCSNAIKFTHKGRVDLVVVIDGSDLTFNVIDTGIGLAAEQIPLLFQNFTQGDSSISRRFGGSGLGLCLSQQLATMMQGVIAVQSLQGKGSLFSLKIPYIICDSVNEASKQQLMQVDHQEPITALTGTVLVADDHADNLRLVSRLLSSVGLTVVEAMNGLEVLTQAELHNPDLYLLDIQMPEMDGIDALKELRQRGVKQPVIALTANAMSHEVEQYLSVGFDDFISKPIARLSFINKVGTYLGQVIAPSDLSSVDEVDTSDLTRSFIAGLDTEHQQLTLALKQFDYRKVAVISHRLAGAALMFGFSDIASLAINLERQINDKQYQSIKGLTIELLAELQKLAMTGSTSER